MYIITPFIVGMLEEIIGRLVEEGAIPYKSKDEVLRGFSETLINIKREYASSPGLHITFAFWRYFFWLLFRKKVA